VTLYTVQAVCAWCDAVMGEREGFKDPAPTHGICETCFKGHYPDMEYPKE